jgi:uncharacterized YccA/Bax inhibitor family protein
MSRETRNPALRGIRFERALDGNAATMAGVSAKTFLLLGLAMLTALWPWTLAGDPEAAGLVSGLMMGGLIGGLVMAMLTIFVKRFAPVTAVLYALLEGLFLGGITAMYEASYPGIAVNAGLLTMGLFTSILVAYATGVVRVTGRFRAFIMTALVAIMFTYIADIVLGMFGASVPFLHASGMLGLGISVVIVVIATLSLALDFDFIQRLEDEGAPKKLEWYAAFSLMVGLVWLYLEVLRLLARRD